MITIHDVGIALDMAGSNRLQHLEQALAYVQSLGCWLVEVDPSPFRTIVYGQLRRPQLEEFVAVLKNFDLRYSIHGLARLNLAYDPRHELCRQIMACQVEICRRVGASRLVCHSGLQALDAVRYGVRSTLLTGAELEEGARREVAAFRDLAPVAADAGVVVCMENSDPHQWEYEVLARCGRPRAELATHHPRLYVEPIVRQLEAIDHPNAGLALDVGHLYIAAHERGFDYLEAVSTAAPWVRHLHVSDNLGLLDQGFDAEHERWPFGEADIHLPPGWGRIPYREVFTRLPGYQGDLILEIKSGFVDYLGEALTTMQEILRGVREKNGE